MRIIVLLFCFVLFCLIGRLHMNEGKWVSQLRDLASRPGVGGSNTPYQVLPTYVEPGVWEGSYGQFYPNTTTAVI